MGHFGTFLRPNLWGISGHATRKKIEKSHGFDPWNISLYLAKSNGLNGNPEIYEKAGAFRHLRHHHFGAVIAIYVTPNPTIKITRPMGRLGNQLRRRLRVEMQI